jgi:hypothetical protein
MTPGWFAVVWCLVQPPARTGANIARITDAYALAVLARLA